ncbi:MAG: amidophosphoribosyltransferase [Deltaproteobacteria bacterium]|nr:amidophosphoribosyltransferase [Deltaproteobacteria bacterium]
MCGIVGIVGSREASREVLIALQAVQHRGQDSCGIATINGERFPFIRKLGLAGRAFNEEDLSRLPGIISVGHTRYPTVGRGSLADAQPLFYRQPGVLLAHNGNLVNYSDLVQRLHDKSVHLLTNCDAEPLLCEFALNLMEIRDRDHTIEDAYNALCKTWKVVDGAYSIVAAMILDGKETLIAARDYRGIRPAVWGERKGAFMVASESPALDALGFKARGDIEAGEVIFFQAGKQPVRKKIAPGDPAPCIFEQIYFARPDSNVEGRSVYSQRLALGRALAGELVEKGIQAEVVIPIPDTSRPAAMALAEELSIPYREGFIKNRYTGRTFIMGDQAKRRSELRLKLNPIRSEFEGKDVLLVDDSIVRGTTLARTISIVRGQGAEKVHLAIYSPPVLFPCYYGIDMSTREELAARIFEPSPPKGGLDMERQRRLEEEFAGQLGLDTLTYLSVEKMDGTWNSERCAACFDGRYPIPLSEEKKKAIENDRRSGRDQRQFDLRFRFIDAG